MSSQPPHPKVFGVGLCKTGTTTLGVALQRLGYRHFGYDADVVRMWMNGQTSELLRMAEDHDSFEDWPWPILFEECDRRWPGSKFVLTTRSSPDAWFLSYVKHCQRFGQRDIHIATLGYPEPFGLEAEHIALYERHNQRVRNYFRDRPRDLLEVCWENGHGWPELCSFLRRRKPLASFPHMNPNPAKRKELEARSLKGRVKALLRWPE